MPNRVCAIYWVVGKGSYATDQDGDPVLNGVIKWLKKIPQRQAAIRLAICVYEETRSLRASRLLSRADRSTEGGYIVGVSNGWKVRAWYLVRDDGETVTELIQK
jgi:hypothetical protein